jgi:two-component system sensor histidine kinase BaeS
VRRRITFAIVGTVIAALVIAGAGTFVLDRLSARESTRRELERQASSLIAILNETTLFRALVNPNASPAVPTTTLARQTELKRIVNRIKGLSNLTEEDIGILVGPTLDRLDGTTPRNITLHAADLAVLKAAPDSVVSGNRGRVVYAAAVGDDRLLKVVVVVARPPGSDARPAFGWFLIASAGTIALGFVIALWLSRGLTQRLRAAQATTHSIASGDLSARVPEPNTSDQDEVADLSRSINSMAVQLERARGLERQFLMSITHDLRTPLTSIQGYAEALSDEAIDPKKAAATILEQAQRLNRLVTDLLDLARLDAQSFSLDITRGDVVGVVAGTVRAFAQKASDKNIALSFPGPSGPRQSGDQGPSGPRQSEDQGPSGPRQSEEQSPAPLFASIDGMRLEQAVGNLLDNALKFARTRIDVTVFVHEGWVAVSVADDGIGIAADDLPHVFERLYVAKSRPTPKESGSGLGLAIVRELVGAMGGHVAARSPVSTADGRPASGTQMLVYLRPA